MSAASCAWRPAILGIVASGRIMRGARIQRAIQSGFRRAPASAREGASRASSGIPFWAVAWPFVQRRGALSPCADGAGLCRARRFPSRAGRGLAGRRVWGEWEGPAAGERTGRPETVFSAGGLACCGPGAARRRGNSRGSALRLIFMGRSEYLYDRRVSIERGEDEIGEWSFRNNGLFFCPDFLFLSTSARLVPVSGLKKKRPRPFGRGRSGIPWDLEQLLDGRAARRHAAVLGHVLDLAAFGLVLLVAVDAARLVQGREQVVDGHRLGAL